MYEDYLHVNVRFQCQDVFPHMKGIEIALKACCKEVKAWKRWMRPCEDVVELQGVATVGEP